MASDTDHKIKPDDRGDPAVRDGAARENKQAPPSQHEIDAKNKIDDELDQELKDTFPASDPPSITQPVHPSRGKDQ